MNNNHDPIFTILVKASNTRVDGLTVEAVNEPDDAPASIIFLTPKGKKWKLKFNEFSFVFPAPKKQAA